MLTLIFTSIILTVVYGTQVNFTPTCNCADSDGVSISNLNISVNIAFDSGHRNSVIQSNGCGITLPRDPRLNDNDSFEGEFPWHTSIYKATFTSIVYQCSATLISTKAVLTSATCITEGAEVMPQQLLVFVGAYHFIEFGGHYQQHKIKNIVLHPQFNHSTVENDVAILQLASSVRVTDYVRPVCLWNYDSSINKLFGYDLIHPGWDYDKTDYINDRLSFIRMPVKPNEQCVFQHARLQNLHNSKSLFCVSFHANTPICKGDEGAGLFFNINGIWYIRGVDSVGIGYQNGVICDEHHYAAITDIVPFIPWMRQFV